MYEKRPGACRAFRCLWLLGHLDEEDRPDKLGVMLSVTDHPRAGRAVMFTEVDKGAMLRPEVVAAISKTLQHLPVAIMREGENVLLENALDLKVFLGTARQCA